MNINALVLLLIFSSLHSMERPIPYRRSLLTQSVEKVEREESRHFARCKREQHRLCKKAIEYAKACNPLVLVHSSPMSMNFTTSEGETLLDLILQNDDHSCLEKKIALSSIFIQKGIDIFHKSDSTSAIEKIIKEQNIILFQQACWHISIEQYQRIIQYLIWHYQQDEAYFEDFTQRCIDIMNPLIQNQRKPHGMSDTDFHQIKRDNTRIFDVLSTLSSKKRACSPTSSIEVGSDEESE